MIGLESRFRVILHLGVSHFETQVSQSRIYHSKPLMQDRTAVTCVIHSYIYLNGSCSSMSVNWSQNITMLDASSRPEGQVRLSGVLEKEFGP